MSVAADPNHAKVISVRSLASRGAVGAATVIGGLVLTVVAVPLILRKVGAGTYGMWATLSLFTGVGGFLDLGVPRSMAFCLGRDGASRGFQQAVFWTSVAIVVGVSLLVGFGGALLIAFTGAERGAWGEIPPEVMSHLLPAGLVLLVTAAPLALLRSLLEYRLRTPDIQAITLVYQLLNSIGILCIAHLSQRVEHLILGTVFATLVAIALHVRAIHVSGGVPGWRRPRFKLGVAILSRSRGHFGLQAANALALPANRYVLVTFDTAGTYAVFDIMTRVALAALSLLQSINIQVYGMALRTRAYGRRHVSDLVKGTTIVSAALWMLGCGTLLVIGEWAYEAFLPRDAGGTPLLLVVVVAGIAASGVAEPSTRALWALGKEGFTATVRATALFINFLLVPLLANSVSLLTAVSVSYSLSIFVGAVLTMRGFSGVSRL